MKKNTKLLALLLTGLFLCVSILPVSAGTTEDIAPYYVNTDTCHLSFVASQGEAHSAISYNAKSSEFSYASVYVKIQKRFLGVFWSTVDEWTETCYDVYGTLYHITTLEETGTYRAVFTVEIYGTNGSVDTIEDKITSTYE